MAVKSRRSRWICVAFVFALGAATFYTGRATAQTEAEKEKARKLFIEGKKLFSQKAFGRAIANFKKAYSYWKRKEIQFNIALAYYNLGDAVGAVTHLRKFLVKASEDEKQAIPSPLMRMIQKVGVLTVQMPDPAAEIWIDGELEGRGRVEKVLKPGRVSIQIRLDDKTVAQKRMSVEAGTHRVWELTQIPKKTKPLPDPAKPRPGEGKDKGGSSLQRLHWAYFAAAAGLAVVSGAVVAGLGAKTLQIQDDWKAADEAGDQDEADSLSDKGVTYRTATNAMIGVTAAAAAGAAVLAIFTRWRSPERPGPEPSEGGGSGEEEVEVHPMISPGGAGVLVRW
jgi:tetratricopeptide (TPR) repeat protein